MTQFDNEVTMQPVETIAPPQAIMRTPGVCGGRACIRGTRIPVWAIVSARTAGVDDDTFLRNFPSITRDDFAAAWDYYGRHTAEIDGDLADQARDD